jgi:peptidoglycan/LPS O-acetylase OafA/YrhL
MPWIGVDTAARMICTTGWPHAAFVEIAAHLTMTHGLFPNGILPDVWISFLGAAWSLSAEWQFYVLAIVLAASDSRRLTRALLALAIAGVAWHLVMPEAAQFSRAFLPNQAHFFALGVASEPVVRRQAGGLGRYGIVLAITLAVCAAQQSLGKLIPPLGWTLCLLTEMCPVVPGLRQANLLLKSRLVQAAGAISYCLYVVNEPIHRVISLVLSRVADGDAVLYALLWIPLAILLPIAVAAWLHVHLEMPLLRRERRAP